MEGLGCRRRDCPCGGYGRFCSCISAAQRQRAGDRPGGRRRAQHGAGLSGPGAARRTSAGRCRADLTRRHAGAAVCSPRRGCKPGVRRYAEPDWAALVREMKRPGVNLMILWEEYRAVHPRGLRLQSVLRAVPRLRAPAVADDAPDPCRRAQGVRRLLRQEGADRRPAHRRGADGGDLRRACWARRT